MAHASKSGPPALDDSLLARLRAETRAEHDAVERTLDLTGGGLTLEAYCRCLERFYGFLRPLEARLASQGGLEAHGVDPGARQRTPLLAADLTALGVDDLERLPLCGDLPDVSRPAEAFGCLYVLEGSTLGGQVICRQVNKLLGVTPETGGRFFRGYGEETGAMWQAFREALTAFADTPEARSRVIESALATFRSLRRWWDEGSTV
ncbi:MAG: biliverdin-producing heme oxygenase [Isosphaeraceae bacterium]